MLERAYATALIRAIESGKSADDVLAGLDRVLARRGHTKLKRKILVTFSRMFKKHARREAATVLLARATDERAYRDEIERMLEGVTYDVAVDESLVGGYVLETTTTRTDRSYKRALLNLYQSITKSR